MAIANAQITDRMDTSFRISLDKDMKEMEAMAKKAEGGQLSEGEMIRYNALLSRWSTKVGLLSKISSTVEETLKSIVNR
jgi:hypothetical protein